MSDTNSTLSPEPESTSAFISSVVITDPRQAESLIQELASLSHFEYESRRDDAAKKLNMRGTILDVAVKKVKSTFKSQSNDIDRFLKELEPSPDPVNGEALLSDIIETILRYVSLPEGAAETVALWVAHTHAHDAAHVSPLLCISSPEKRCGKTTLLSILQALVKKPLPTSNITSASLFRATEKWRPTLLIDEADCFLAESQELRGILNSGHRRDLAFVLRTINDDHEPSPFSTWAPKAIALIGEMHPTLADRSLIISMRRKRSEERVERLRLDQMDIFNNLHRRVVRWVQDNLQALKLADPNMPSELNDRAADNWRPLLAIADLAGGEWPQRARHIAQILNQEESDEATGILILEDIQKLFIEESAMRFTSKGLIERLIQIEERPWLEWSHGRPLTVRQLARLLKPFGIYSKNLRFDDYVSKGYELGQFEDAFSRYLKGRTATNE